MLAHILLSIAVIGLPDTDCPAPTSPPAQGEAVPVPRIWTWDKPLEPVPLQHVLDGTIRPMIRVHAGGQHAGGGTHVSPDDAADQILEIVELWSLAEGDVCVLLQGLGHGDGLPVAPGEAGETIQHGPALYQHWCDGLGAASSTGCDQCPPPDAESGDWLTYWMRNGICESQTWMEQFIAAYASRDLPEPTRFHFDTEFWPIPSKWGELGVDAFLRQSGLAEGAAAPDPRWDDEIIPGHGLTLATLFQAAQVGEGVTAPVPGSWLLPANRAWTRWYESIGLGACDGAMNCAFYEPIRAAWPQCLGSNFETSIRVDGQADFPWAPLRRYRSRLHQSADWFTLVVHGSADMQAPQAYPASSLHFQGDETPGRATVRVQRANLEACLDSFDGWNGARMAPWLPMIGTGFEIYHGQPDVEYFIDKADLREMLLLCRGLGIGEFIFWSDIADGGDWVALDDLVSQVWGAEAVDPRLRVADRRWQYGRTKDVVSVASTPDAGSHAATITADLTSSFDRTTLATLQIVADVRLADAGSATVTVEMFDWCADAWETLDLDAPATAAYVDRLDPVARWWMYEDLVDGSGYAVDTHRSVLTALDTRPGAHVGDDGAIRVRLRLESAASFTAEVDLLQVAEADDDLVHEGDCDGNGVPDTCDLAADPGLDDDGNGVLDVCDAAGDVNGDGVVDVGDLVAVITAWGPCPAEPPCPADVNHDGLVGVNDLVAVILNWD